MRTPAAPPISLKTNLRLNEDQRRQLAGMYAPVIYAFPARADLARPDGGKPAGSIARGDFLPRPVDIVLDHAHLHPGFLGVVRNPRILLEIHQSHPWLRHLPYAIRRRLPAQDPSARARLPDLLRGRSHLATSAILDLIGVGRSAASAQRAWENYHQILAADSEGRYRPRVYARVLQGDEVIEWSVLERLRWYSSIWARVDDLVRTQRGPFSIIADEIEGLLDDMAASMEEVITGIRPVEDGAHDVAVQYWFLYYYNDWNNRHEVDWETITIILRAPSPGPVSPDTLTPTIVGYANHVSGRRRPWLAVEREDTHPSVYSARGSHASYFKHRAQGYAAGLPLSITVPFANLNITSHIRRGERGYRDWVPDPAELPHAAAKLRPEQEYALQLLPNLNPRPFLSSHEDIDTLAWLVYPGFWGSRPAFSIGGSGPHGPLWQGLKSDNPFKWVRRKCQADDDYSL